MINLLPKTEQKEIRWESMSHQLMNFWIWVVVSLAVLFLLGVLSLAQTKRLSSRTDADITKARESLNSSTNQELEKQVLALNTQISTINQIRSQHYEWSEALIALGNLIPSDMLVDILSLNRASGEVKITGVAGDRASVIKFWSDVHKTTYFKNINFPLSNLETAKNTPFTFTFFINEAQIKP